MNMLRVMIDHKITHAWVHTLCTISNTYFINIINLQILRLSVKVFEIVINSALSVIN